MSYKFVRITTYYKEYIKDFYQRYPEVHLESYSLQYQKIIKDSIESSSSFVKFFNKIGVNANEIISNASILQDTWKKENNIKEDISQEDLIIQQIKVYQPNVVWIDDLSLLDDKWKTKLLKEVPSIKLFVGHHCAPSNENLIEKLKLFDVLFTCTPGLKKGFAEQGINSHLLYHSFDVSVLENIKENNSFPVADFTFTGSLYSGAGFHKKRIEYIESILSSGIKMELYSNLESFKKIVLKKVFYNVIKITGKVGLTGIMKKIPAFRNNISYGETPISFYSKNLIKSSKPPVFGLKMYQVLYKSNICFNVHGDIAGNCAGNIRLFEATGSGACLVTDWKENIDDLFVPGKEIITYKSKEECIQKVKWLLENPEERLKIAKAGQKRTLENHNVEKRVAYLNQLFLEKLN